MSPLLVGHNSCYRGRSKGIESNSTHTDVSEEDVTIVPMKTCFELLLDVNPGASIQLDGAARLIRKCHNSTLEIHHVCHVRSKLSHVAGTVSITLQYLNGPELYHFDL